MAKFSEPEQAIIGSELAIPRMISGLWQLAGGHDEKVDIGEAAEAMNPLYVSIICHQKLTTDNIP